ncbi:hypothetical protein WBG78_16325 [Chryseolinea sp. T2]|uniref:hypothetical protein n=1 Tax=Chryseolinea sp. T2 TaxID=3129255 RepID=UPI0030786A4A
MRKQLAVLALLYAAMSCDKDSDATPTEDAMLGLWNREIVYLNGTNSDQIWDNLNGTNHLQFNRDKTFGRAYEIGHWVLSGKSLTLDRDESTGGRDWIYDIIENSKDKLVLEIKLRESEYCCDFDAFSDTEIITIREVYRKVT